MNRKSYNAIATEWDTSRKDFHGKERVYIDAFLSGLPANSLILDLGCGTGRPIAEYVITQGHAVIGVDQSENLLALARARFPNERWIHSRIEDFGFAAPFSGAIAWDSLFHIERTQHEPILRRVTESISAGGRIMLSVGGSDHPAFTDEMFGEKFFYDSNTPEQTLDILTRLGWHMIVSEFTNLPTGERDKGRYAIVAQLGEISASTV